MGAGYTVEEVFQFEDFSRHRNVLLAGPTTDTVRPVAHRLLSALADETDALTCLTTELPASLARATLSRETDIDPERIGVVDCTESDVRRLAPDDREWFVRGPTDFTGMGIAMDHCRRKLEREAATSVHLVFDTVSTLLVRLDSAAVFRHVHQLSVQDGVGLFPVYTNLTGGIDLERLKHLFDALVEVRRRGGVREIRCTGFESTPTGWVPLAPETASRADHG